MRRGINPSVNLTGLLSIACGVAAWFFGITRDVEPDALLITLLALGIGLGLLALTNRDREESLLLAVGGLALSGALIALIVISRL